MRPLSELAPAEIRGLFFDIDDTLTTEGRLTSAAYAALARWKAAGKIAVPITGRPAGWCDHIARMWPVDAVVGENGAFYFRYDQNQRKLEKHFLLDEATRVANRARMVAVRDRILAQVPGSALASDQLYREADLAIDFCEDVPHLGLPAAKRIAELMRAAGMTAKISSIHVNGWFGDYDKLGMTRTLSREKLGIDLDQFSDTFAFVGDSPNDAPMFTYFKNSVGVANVCRYEGVLTALPAFVTRAEAGTGFTELVIHLLGS